MSRYAENTSVSAEKSKGEIERTLERYGASGFMYGWEESDEGDHRAMIQFKAHGKRVRFILPLPAKEEFRYTPAKRLRRSDRDMLKQWEQGCRQRWRALALCVKAKLEAVEADITTFEDEFLAHIVLPSGETAGAWLLPQIEQAYVSGEMPKLLPAGSADES